ncbi:MAG: collagen-like protein, partial [Oscillospiraceae bacterium]|nr:collagen-like protein [Oscillospiraceae bacterium]
MGSKKQIIAVVLLVALLGLGGAGFSWQREEARANAFEGNGYIHISDMEKTEKRVMFRSGTTWKRSLSDTVTFENSQGEQQKVSVESFLHYDDGCLAAFTDGVVVDLNDLATAKVTNHYALSSSVVFENNGAGYVLPNNAADTTFTEFLWKLSESKYMLVAPRIQLRFSETDVREVEDYVEVTYIDEGVIQLQTKENVWQTISNTCLAELDNDEKVDFNLRNVQDDEGEVLADFSKMVLDSENNIEVTPLTEDLRNVHENVIPHFEITAEPGKQGEEGEKGETGVSGETGEDGETGKTGEAGEAGEAGDPGTAGTAGAPGEQGAAGQAGSNGAAGASGTNGGAGSPGAPGAPGNNGESPSNSIDTEVLKMPEFTIVNWSPTATGCSGKIMVANGDLLVPNGTAGTDGEEKYSRVYVVDALTGTVAGEAMDGSQRFEFSQERTEYDFAIGNLEPDREYILMVEAPINTYTGSKGTYVRAFVTKRFYTDSVGISMEAGSCGVDSLSLTVNRQDYAATFDKVTVYFYATRGAAASATANDPGTGSVHYYEIDPATTPGNNWPVHAGGNMRSAVFSSNTTYYARVVVKIGDTKMMPAQILSLKTLKKAANISAPLLSSNRSNWGFDLTPGVISDPDGGITRYRYEFIQYGGEERDILKTVETTSANSLTVPIDGARLRPGESYQARLVVTFYDNEKTYEITSGWSNPAAVEGGQLPIVQYVNDSQAGSGGTGEGTDPSGTSDWYDRLSGTVRVIPSTNGSKLMLDADHVPYVTIRASGYYYVKYPVYPEGAVPSGAVRGTYLVGKTVQGGEVEIQIPNRTMADLKLENEPEASGTVDGLRANTAYRLIVSGDLTDDGVTVKDSNITVGVCVVTTPRLQQVGASLTYLDSDAGTRDTLRSSVLRLFANDTPTDAEAAALARQQEALTTVTIEAFDALSASQATATIVLKEENYKELLVSSGLKTQEEADALNSLGELMTDGLALTQTLFQKAGTPSYTTANKSVQYIRVSSLLDYTSLAGNTNNQNAYVPSDANDPEDTGRVDGMGYTNQYTLGHVSTQRENDRISAEVVGLEEGYSLTYEIQLGATPDPIPEPEKGLTVTAHDDDKDRNADDRYTLVPNYANGSKQARWITFYVFDYPDFHKDYTQSGLGMAFDNGENGAFKNMPENLQFMTAVTAVDGAGKGTWLTKIRVPVPISGDYKNQMPKVEFIPQTASEYFAGKPSELQKYQDDLARVLADDRSVVADNNTWKLFYPEGSTETKTGHQFVFAWTMEYESKSGTETTIKYYPFEITGETGYTGVGKDSGGTEVNAGFYKGIPHSKAVVAPRHLPTVYAKSWDTDPATGTVMWKVWISDPDGAVVVDHEAGGTSYAAFYQYVGPKTANNLYEGDAGAGVRPTAVIWDEEPEETSTGASVVTIRMPANAKTLRTGL